IFSLNHPQNRLQHLISPLFHSVFAMPSTACVLLTDDKMYTICSCSAIVLFHILSEDAPGRVQQGRATMGITVSRRDLLHAGCGATAAIGVSALAGGAAQAQAVPQCGSATEDLFYREDWFGEPWRKPETAVLIHGNDES